MSAKAVHDVIVVGAGPAGVSAAIECFDVQLDVVVFEAATEVGGQIGQIPHAMRNVVTASPGNDAVVGALAGHASTLGDRLRLGLRVDRIDVATTTVQAGGELYRARSLLIATGSRRRQLAVAPEGGFGGAVTYQLEPYLERFAGREMVVVGGGDSAALDALALADTGSAVALVHRAPRLSARRDLVEQVRSSGGITDLAGWSLDALAGAGRLESVDLSNPGTGDHRRLEAAGIVLKLGREKCVDLVRGQVELGGHGGIAVDAGMQTSDPGAFAAGDVTDDAYERVATAVGQGSLAVRSILTHLQTCG